MHAKYEISISYGSKITAKVKVDNRQTNKQTDKQTGQKQYAPNHSIRGHKQEAQRATYRAPEYNVQPSRKSLSNSDARVAILFTDQPKKHKLSRGRWDLASCQVSLNSIQRFQRKSRKWLSQSEARGAILFFRSARKTQTWLRTLRSCFLSSFVEFRSAVSEKKSKMSQPIRGHGGHLVFLIVLKNTNLVEDVEILLPVKFR